jgi:hypothetical protein
MNPMEIKPVEGFAAGVNGFRCLPQTGYLSLSAWLEHGLGDNGGLGAAERLFEQLRAFREGRRKVVTLSRDPEWVVRVDALGATVHYMPPVGAPCTVTVDELVETVLRWYDAVRPPLAARLRAILDGSVASRVPNAATRILAAVLDAEEPSGPAIEQALGVPLALERRSDPMEYFTGRFDDGPFESADFRHNTRTRLAILVFPPRGLSFHDLDFDALGGQPEFRGFQFVPEAEESHVLDLGDRSLQLSCERGRGPLRSVAVHWNAK